MEQGFLNFAVGTLVALFPIANPIGAVPVFYSLTANDSHQDRLQLAQRTALNVTWVLAVFLLGGRAVLQFFGISLDVLRIAGGLLVAHAAWQMVTSQQRLTASEHQAGMEKEDISFTPMAVPMVAGPGAIGVVIGLSSSMGNWTDYLGSLIGIILFGSLLYLCLALGESLLALLGQNGFGALNRIFGFFILAIAVQLVATGSLSLLKQTFLTGR